MLIVLDSNVLLSAIGHHSPLQKIWKSFIAGEFSIAINEDILKEYEEILQRHAAVGSAKIVMDIFEEIQEVVYQRVS